MIWIAGARSTGAALHSQAIQSAMLRLKMDGTR
jgi:hypothetical protein